MKGGSERGEERKIIDENNKRGRGKRRKGKKLKKMK